MSAFSVGQRVEFEGVGARIVGRIDKNFVEVLTDVPLQRENYAGVPYTADCFCAHVALLTPEGALF